MIGATNISIITSIARLHSILRIDDDYDYDDN